MVKRTGSTAMSYKIRRSSFGTAGARSLRARTPAKVTQNIVTQSSARSAQRPR